VASSAFPDNIINNPLAQPAKKRTRSSVSDVLKRSQRLYARQLEGKTTRQLVIEHANIEGISETTAWLDWDRVKVWNNEDWEKDRESLLPRLQAMRVRLFNKAVKKGQLQTAAQILDSLGKVIGESVETVNIQAPELSIKVEPKN
tara:strand:- start:141 stop:575 length:435 start_codon:yes stop_codon:yes gene_type:complete